jgi:hypothetical protein
MISEVPTAARIYRRLTENCYIHYMISEVPTAARIYRRLTENCYFLYVISEVPTVLIIKIMVLGCATSCRLTDDTSVSVDSVPTTFREEK